MRDDLAKYSEGDSAVGKRFRGRIDGMTPRTYTIVRVLKTKLEVSYRKDQQRTNASLCPALHAQDPRVYSRRSSLPAFNPALDEVDSPFSLAR